MPPVRPAFTHNREMRATAVARSSFRALIMRALSGVIVFLAPASAAASADRDGSALFRLRCASCHTAGQGEANKMGPNLSGVVGRPSGASPKFRYSAALSSGKVTWSPPTLDLFLANPARVAPGTSMPPVGVANAQDRAKIITFLKGGAAPAKR